MFPVGLCLTNTIYKDHNWWTWFHVPFFKVPFHHSKVWSILHQRSVTRVHKKILLNYFIFFFGICLSFFIVCAFIIFTSIFDEVSILRNRILTNQKLELVISNCQWNCMVFNKYFIPGPYLMGPISCNFFRRSVLHI